MSKPDFCPIGEFTLNGNKVVQAKCTRRGGTAFNEDGFSPNFKCLGDHSRCQIYQPAEAAGNLPSKASIMILGQQSPTVLGSLSHDRQSKVDEIAKRLREDKERRLQTPNNDGNLSRTYQGRRTTRPSNEELVERLLAKQRQDETRKSNISDNLATEARTQKEKKDREREDKAERLARQILEKRARTSKTTPTTNTTTVRIESLPELSPDNVVHLVLVKSGIIGRSTKQITSDWKSTETEVRDAIKDGYQVKTCQIIK